MYLRSVHDGVDLFVQFVYVDVLYNYFIMLKVKSIRLWSNIRVPMGSHVYTHRAQKTLQ